MSWYCNNYQKLVQENKDAIAKISGESFKTMQKMFEYMAMYNISLFELEVIKKDLIGAALEADMEGIDFTDKLGMPEKEFCDSLVKEGMGNGRLERAVLLMRDAVLALSGFYFYFWLLDGIPWNYGITPAMLFIVVWGLSWNYMINRKAQGMGAYLLTDRVRWWLSFGGLMVWVAVYMFFLERTMMRKMFFVSGNAIVILLILAVLSAVAFFGNNYYWNKRSEKYNWQ